jgi:hypothetical protein
MNCKASWNTTFKVKRFVWTVVITQKKLARCQDSQRAAQTVYSYCTTGCQTVLRVTQAAVIRPGNWRSCTESQMAARTVGFWEYIYIKTPRPGTSQTSFRRVTMYAGEREKGEMLKKN